MIVARVDLHVTHPPTQQPDQRRTVRQTGVNSQQPQRDVVRPQRQHVDLPEWTVPRQSAAEHRLDVPADFHGALAGERRPGEHVVRQVEASVDDPSVAATRLTDELLSEASVRDLGRVGGLQGMSRRRRTTII